VKCARIVAQKDFTLVELCAGPGVSNDHQVDDSKG
jgi:hypothetical protein